MAESSSVDTSLPTGTVTFAFTDIEGSTGIAQRFGASYSALLAEHFDILRGLLKETGGVEVKTTGDGLFAVFSSALSAADWAKQAQKAMAEHVWPDGGVILVRIGLHTGEAEPDNGDYSGLEVNVAARVMDAGHGGQVLLSGATRNLIRGNIEFRHMGPHQLRGLDGDVDIYQLVVDGLAQEFAPLRTASSGTNNLPARLTSIIGRDSDVTAVLALLEEARLVTLLGPGGVGKTSLAVAVAGRLVESFPDGVVWVDLSSVSDAALVPATIARALEIDVDSVDGIASLHGDSTLLLIDNFEQVIGASGDLVALLGSTTATRFLVTSQAPLRIPGEQRYNVEPLRVNGAAESPGVRLFMERARAADPEYRADPEEVRSLVAQLDGLPLAIELVAARANVLTPAEMGERLAIGRVPIALGEAPERHRSLEAALEWSIGLLEEDDRSVFRRLGVFAAGMTLDAAEHVSGPVSGDPLDHITRLVDRSLLVRETGSRRIRMLDGVRRYARGLLAESVESEDVVRRYIDFFYEIAQEAYAGLQSDRGEWWRSRLDAELDNLRDVFSRLHVSGQADKGLEMVGDVWRFFHSRGLLHELELWLERFFELGSAGQTIGVVKGLMAKGALRYWQNRGEDAIDSYREAVKNAEGIGDEAVIADAIFGLASSQIVYESGDDSAVLLERAKRLYQQMGDMGGVADVVAAEIFASLRRSGLSGLGPKFEEAERLYSEAGRSINASQCMFGLAGVAVAEGRFEDARRHAQNGIERGEKLADRSLVVWGVEYVALVEIEVGDQSEGALLIGAAEAAREEIGGGWGPTAVGLEDGRAILERHLGVEEAERQIAAGRSIGIDEALALLRS